MDNKLRLGILGGGGDSLIGVLHRVASSMHDKYRLIGGVFNPEHSISLDSVSYTHLTLPTKA